MAPKRIVQLPEIRVNDRMAIFGRTGTGKSILAHFLFRTIPVPPAGTENPRYPFWRICIDITDSVFDPDSVEFFDPAAIPWNEAYSLRFVPDADDLESQVNLLYLEIMAHGSCWIWLDEANEVSSSHKTVFGLRKVLLQGRKFQIGHCAVTPRPVDINKSIITQSEHIFIFALTDPDDRIKVAKSMGMTIDELDKTMAALEDFGYLWYSVRDAVLFTMPALPVEIVTKLE